jgi:cobalt-zinc-cadmium efflux system outer membrane protein
MICLPGLIGFVLLLLVNFTLYAKAETGTLTLQEAFALAFSQNPKFKAKQMDFQIGLADLQTAGLRDNPVLISDSGIAEKTYRVGIKQTIPLGFRHKHQVLLAKAQLNVAQAQIDTARLALKKDVRTSYIQLYIAQQKRQLLESINGKLQKKIVANKMQTNEQRKLKLYQAKIFNKMEMANAEVFQANSKLNSILNKPLTQQWILTFPNALSYTNDFLNVLIDRALSSRPEIKQKDYEIEAAKEEMALAKSKRIPDLVLTVGPDWVTEPGEGEVGAFFISNLEVPIFNRNQGQIQKQTARVMQLEYEKAELKNQIPNASHERLCGVYSGS